MTTSCYTITDIAGTSGTVTVDARDLAETITPWYPEAPAEVYEVIEALQDQLLRGEDTGGAQEYLGVTVDRAPLAE
jgi:hypothetical protein